MKVGSESALHGILALFFIGPLLIAAIMFGWPQYRVYTQGMRGKGELKRAEQQKLIMIETAKAELEASKLRAEAIAVVGEAAQQFPEYRQQEFIAAFGEAIQNESIHQIIYVPTEANIPIIEAGRR